MGFSSTMSIAASSNIFNGHADRYVAGGYKDGKPLDYRLSMLEKVGGITGVDLGGGSDVTVQNASQVKELLKKYHLVPSAITPNLNGERRFAFGSICSPDEDTRKQAWENVKDSIDSARIIGCGLINLWLGQDGFDYCFQADYAKAFRQLVEFLQAAADYNPQITISVEYKVFEPRKRIFTSTAAVTLAIIEKAGRANLGVTVDNGHAWNAGEHIAETVGFLKVFGDRLRYAHINDNFKLADDDMIIGSLHMVETLEFLYWLEKTGYKGFYTLDVDPSKESAFEFAQENVAMLLKLQELQRTITEKDLEPIFAKNDASAAVRLLRQKMLK